MILKGIYLSPKSISIHIFVVVTERCICKWSSFYIHVIEFSHVCPDNLIGIDKYNLQIYTLIDGEKLYMHVKLESIRRWMKWKQGSTLCLSRTWNQITFSKESGKITSRNRILYAQIIRCFSFCLCNHVGHL